MAHRNFSMIDYFNRRIRDWAPELSFRGETAPEWQSWRAEASAKLAELLGEFPQAVDPAAEIVYSVEDDGLVRERVIFDSEADMSVPCTVLRPADMPRDGKAPAILCSHGHGPYGKEPVAGNDTSEGLRASIGQLNYSYGEQMARRGSSPSART